MPLRNCNPPTIKFSWATIVVALFLILTGASCNQQPELLPSLEIDQEPPPPSRTAVSPVPVETFTPQPSRTSPILANTPTQIPSSLPTQTEETQRMPFIPIIGGADKIAFINQNEIWMANLDGQEITQLTDDNLLKSSLQWSPDNSGVIYIADLCIYSVDTDSLQTRQIACFEQAQKIESFKLSPDANQAAISLDGQLYVVPFDEERLNKASSGEDLIELADCETLGPYKHRASRVTVSKARWSADGKHLAILRQAYDDDQQVELIQVIDITRCAAPIPRLDEFPATRFEMEGYERHPIIQDFAWNGADLFALTSYKRNDGFGDLWIYSTDLHRGYNVNPIGGKCCYRDPVFSPDGKYLAFVFQDSALSPNRPAVLYYMPYAALESGLVYPPLSLPADFFSESRTKPQPILRSAR